MSTALHEQLVVDSNGHPQAVMLPWAEYRRLLSTVEDLEDALDLRQAVRTASHFLTSTELLHRVKRMGRR